jgi:hypothetical protein
MSSRTPSHRNAVPCKPEVTLLVSSNVPHTADRLKVNDGVQLASQELTSQDYAPEAYIPVRPFRCADATYVMQRAMNETPARSRTVGVLKISERLLTQFRKAAAAFSDPCGLECCIDDLCSEIPPPWRITQPPARLALGRNAAGLHTVTRDPFTGRYVGLHVDTFDRAYDDARVTAGNRISINIGVESRRFLFVPLPFKRLFMPGGQNAGTNVVTEFLRTHTGQPVLSLHLDPGEGYIAPTEGMIHDASSLAMRSEDVHVTGRGIFEPGAP